MARITRVLRLLAKAFRPMGRVTRGKYPPPVKQPARETLDAVSLEQAKIEYAARFEEYRAVRAEIIQNLASQHQLITVSIAAIGALLAASKWIVDSRNIFLFLLGSWVLFGIVWMQLRYAQSNMALLNYVVSEFAPAFRQNLSNLSPARQPDVTSLFAAERTIRKTGYAKTLWELPLEGSRYGITLIAATTSYAVYIFLLAKIHQTHWYDRPVIALNVVLTLYTVVMIARVRRTFVKLKIQ